MILAYLPSLLPLLFSLISTIRFPLLPAFDWGLFCLPKAEVQLISRLNRLIGGTAAAAAAADYLPFSPILGYFHHSYLLRELPGFLADWRKEEGRC